MQTISIASPQKTFAGASHLPSQYYWGKYESRAGCCDVQLYFEFTKFMPKLDNPETHNINIKTPRRHKRDDPKFELLIHQFAQRNDVDKS